MPPALERYLVRNSFLDELLRRGWGLTGEPHFDRFALIFIYFLLGFVVIVGLVLLLTWMERRVLGSIQSRVGPNRVGFRGLFQPVADTVKFFQKEDIVPWVVDKWPHLLASVAVFLPIWVAFSLIPFGKVGTREMIDPVTGEVMRNVVTNMPQMEGIYLVGKDVGAGLIIVLALAAINMTGLLMAGWGSNNKYSMLGALRAIAVLISYEIPMLTVLLAVGVAASSFQLTDIVEAQTRIWFLVPQVFGAFVFFCCILAEDSRNPFDLPQAESELAAGYHTEYSGFRFALFYLAEYGQILIFSSLFVLCFLGGWLSPFRHLSMTGFLQTFFNPQTVQPALDFLGTLSPYIQRIQPPLWISTTFWFFLKVFGVSYLFFWLRGTLPRFRVDQLMDYSWKFLLPLSLFNLILVGMATAYRHPWFLGNMDVINPVSRLEDQVAVPYPWEVFQPSMHGVIEATDPLFTAKGFYKTADLIFHGLYWVGALAVLVMLVLMAWRIINSQMERNEQYKNLVEKRGDQS